MPVPVPSSLDELIAKRWSEWDAADTVRPQWLFPECTTSLQILACH